MPPPVVLAALYWFGTALGAEVALAGYRGPHEAILRITAVAALWIGATSRRSALRWAALLLAPGLAAMGSALDARPASIAVVLDAPAPPGAPLWIGGTLEREPVATGSGSRFLLRTTSARLAGRELPVYGRVEIVVSEPPTDWLPGLQLRIFTALVADHPLANPGVRPRDRLRARGLEFRGRLKSYRQVRVTGPPHGLFRSATARLRQRVRGAIGRRFAEASMLRALLLGERTDLPDRLWQQLDRAGLLHLLAISGLHVGLMVGGVTGAARRTGLPPPVVHGFGLATAFLIVVLVEPRAPVHRAALMASFFLLGRASCCRTAPLDALAGALLLLLAIEPGAAAQLGFRLSAIAALALVAAGEHFPSTAVGQLLAGSIVAQATVAPLLALTTWRVVLSAPLWNLLGIPVLGIALALALTTVGIDLTTGGLLARSPPTPWLEPVIGRLGAATDWLLRTFVSVAARGAEHAWTIALPGASAALAASYWAALLAARSLRGRRGHLALALTVPVVALATRPPATTDAPQLLIADVGQGDAIVLRTRTGAVLIDAGGYPGIDYDVGYHVVAPQLRRMGIGRLAVTAVSHAHADHAGGVPGVIREVGGEELWVGSTPPSNSLAVRVRDAANRAGATLMAPRPGGPPRRFVGCDWSVPRLGAPKLLHGATEVSNAASLVLDVTCGAHRLFLAGDADTDAELEWLAGRLPSRGVNVLLKVGHHGSATSTGTAFLEQLDPRHAFISVGARNPWGLPRPEVVTRLRQRGVSLYRTDRDGALSVTLGRRVEVWGQRWVRGTVDPSRRW